VVKRSSILPVVTIYHDRLQKMLGSSLDLEHVIDRIPHLGVDIEERTDQYLRIEYNPNRPDFSTDYGIIRSLKGLLKIELGLPEYRVQDGKTTVSTDPSISKVRPHILCLEATNLNLDEESLRQLISMQEDLHNGIGRKRRKVSIGFHDFNSFKPPLKYTTMTKDFQFTPLGSSRKMSIEDILRDTEQGVTYGSILDGFEVYPLIIDSNGQTISFPPIINSEITKLTNSSRNLFVEITATDLSAAQDVLMVVSSTLHDAGSTLHSVKISYPETEMITPDMAPVTRNLKTTEVNRLLGTELTEGEIIECLSRIRFGANVTDEPENLSVIIPPYRVDILHEIDLVEEVALGYGIENLVPTLPKSELVGVANSFQKQMNLIREIAVGLGLIEAFSFSLVGSDLTMDLGIHNEKLVRVKESKSAMHSVLRGSLIPSLLSTLKRNTHEEYPQKIFELAPIFLKDDSRQNKVREETHLAVAIAHKQANYSEVKSYLTSILSTYSNIEFKTNPCSSSLFIQGRGAAITADGAEIGLIGEVHPKIISDFQIKIPVAALEVDLTTIIRKQDRT